MVCKEKKRNKINRTKWESSQRTYQKCWGNTYDIKRSKREIKYLLTTTKYYSEYFAVYALLIRIGVKSEIHECTIEIAKLLEREGILPVGVAKILERDKELRIENQYYLKKCGNRSKSRWIKGFYSNN